MHDVIVIGEKMHGVIIIGEEMHDVIGEKMHDVIGEKMHDVIVRWWRHKIRLFIENERENGEISMNKIVFIFDFTYTLWVSLQSNQNVWRYSNVTSLSPSALKNQVHS